MLAMALRWLTASDKIAIEFLKQFGVSLMKGKNPNMTPEFNRYLSSARLANFYTGSMSPLLRQLPRRAAEEQDSGPRGHDHALHHRRGEGQRQGAVGGGGTQRGVGLLQHTIYHCKVGMTRGCLVWLFLVGWYIHCKRGTPESKSHELVVFPYQFSCI